MQDLELNRGTIALLAFGALACAATLAGGIAALATSPSPLTRPQLWPVWGVVVLLGALSFRIVPFFFGLLRRPALARIDEAGVENLKDGLGPIAWQEIRGASIRELGYTFRVGYVRVLFVEVAEEVAQRLARDASPLVRSTFRRRVESGVAEIPLMGFPPYSLQLLEKAREEILRRVASGV